MSYDIHWTNFPDVATAIPRRQDRMYYRGNWVESNIDEKRETCLPISKEDYRTDEVF
jgi:hypothetical protein